MSHSSLLLTPCTLPSVDPTTSPPQSPPQTTDEDSECSDMNRPHSNPSRLVAFPPSCQLTPPTPPSNIEIQRSSPVKDFISAASLQETQVVRRKRRQKLAPLPARNIRIEDDDDDDDEEESLQLRSNTDDSTFDYSPVRKTRRKSLRIRELSRHSGQSSDKLDVSEGCCTGEFHQIPSDSQSESTVPRGGLNNSRYYKEYPKDDNRCSSNNLQREELVPSNQNSPLALLSSVAYNAGKTLEKEDTCEMNTDSTDHTNITNELSENKFSYNSITTRPTKAEGLIPNIKVPGLSSTPGHLRGSSKSPQVEIKREPLIISNSKPNIGQSDGRATDRLQGIQRIDYQPRLQNRQPVHPPSMKHNSLAYQNLLHHGRKSLVLPTTPHLQHLHQLQMPQDDETHVCIECNKVFKRSIYLQRHMAREHWTTAKLFKCDTCSYETKHQSNLLVHKRTHTGERPYYCGECGQRYTQGHLLKAHIRSRHSSNMQLYNMEKRSPNEILAAQTAASSSIETGESKRRSPSDCNKKNPATHSVGRMNDSKDTVANRSSIEGLEKIQFLVDAATSFQSQKHFQQRNHFDKNQVRSIAKTFSHHDQVMNDATQEAEEDREVINYGGLKHSHYHQQPTLVKDQSTALHKKGDVIHHMKMSARTMSNTNGEVINLDTPEPQVEFESSDKINSSQGIIQNGNISPGVRSSLAFKSDQRKFDGVMTSHTFPYSNILNFPQTVEYFQPPPPPLNSSIMFNTFLTPCLPASYPVDADARKSTLRQNSREDRPPLNISSSSCSEGEDQFVDVDGDVEDDVKPLNLSTQKAKSSENFTHRIASKYKRERRSPLRCNSHEPDQSLQFSAFKTLYGYHEDGRSVIKSVHQKLIPDSINRTTTNSANKEQIHKRNPGTSFVQCHSSSEAGDKLKFGFNKTSGEGDESSVILPNDNIVSGNCENHPSNGIGNLSSCQGGADQCPDRHKLESLRRDVYKMLRVFMPYFILDDIDGKTDALDNFLHEVLYSKLEG